MLTVVTPPAGSRLTTLERARALLGFAAGQDAVAERCIDLASALAVDWCRRPFALTTYRETFPISPGDGVLLARGPVTTFTSVVQGETTLDPAEYAYDAELGRLYRQDAAGYLWRWWGPLTVTYSAGYTLPADTGTWTLPPPVERAAILLAGAALTAADRDPLVRSETVEGVGSTTWWVPGSSGLPSPEAESLLQPYRRVA
ncbi:hypothetical protein [Enterovirga rhinocerotis]|uniref:PhiE125 gp8 family phage protein n=1 Tax=Enterovirga rhinocerotis TaxID=1339210 RepID=A0A4R7BWQ1_9HYPH|nr:hypothetical protein [Enterovirga rhinocerotis]TDR89115.1 hypothetical protein EV668_3603 [Enterovirga rhinocerotis]